MQGQIPGRRPDAAARRVKDANGKYPDNYKKK